MKWSQYFLPTLREDPKDSDAVSYKLMMRAGLIRRLGSGAYTYLPLGLRALHKAAAVVREEMNRAGAQELLMPALQPVDLWKATGRYEVLGDVLIKFKDRTGKEMALGPTHEEVVTDLLKEIRSHKQLPVTVYQIQTKFRDEPRPRSGVIRSKEFLMKDAYSFDVDAQGLGRSYQAMYDAYQRIFARCGLTVIACEADPGMMGGDASHEFMAPSEAGEDRIVRCESCGYAANLEAARSAAAPAGGQPAETPKPLEVVKTPGAHTVEQVSAFLKVPPSKLIKTLLYDVDKSQVAVLVRGDHEVNEAKLARLLGTAQVKLCGPQTIERLSGAPVGFTGPVKLNVRLIADPAVMAMANAVAGANQAEAHIINANPGRDFQPATVADVRFVTEADRCPKCSGPLTIIKAIEVGHVFKLGTKYTQALGASVQDQAGKAAPMIMGCYGIGVNRIVASAIEQRHDTNGIVWPIGLAPFQVVVSVMESTTAEMATVGEETAQVLEAAGFEVLLDDREHSPGAKLKDADLIGIPVQVVIGKSWQREQQLELCLRATKEKTTVPRETLVEAVRKHLDKASSL
ncbi:MAG: proline--tRNA ligase [Candidatus Omnitrophica bacterium CG11_big_fil_rev_8_21_14_0_20_63_9]|nr:MAG: proline--tRNA ligase [Candidatus Omnitrophica bacterium CG11_big_fil_rev_8_21_14_0_20_63_9]